jgi:hypothetical protein
MDNYKCNNQIETPRKKNLNFLFRLKILLLKKDLNGVKRIDSDISHSLILPFF